MEFSGHEIHTTFDAKGKTGVIVYKFDSETLEIIFDDGGNYPDLEEELHSQWELLLEFNVIDLLKAKFAA
jgi:hypothetical protein